MFFQGVPETELESTFAHAERRMLPGGSLVVSEGDYLEEMYVVISGAADVSVTNDNGRSDVVARIESGETIGEMSLLTHEPASADVRAREDLDVFVLRERDVDDLMDRTPRIQRNVISILSARLAHMNRMVREQRARAVFVEDTNGADRDGRELGAAGLAASIAWHTQESTLHVTLADGRRPRLEQLATLPSGPAFRPSRQRSADYVVVRPEGAFDDTRIGSTLDDLADVFAHVVVEHPPAWRPPAAAKLCFNTRTDQLPVLARDDEQQVALGVLPPTGQASLALAGLARLAVGLRVGVALGSGSVRGYAHIGALRELERLGIPIDCVAGTSIGAIVGGLYCHFQDTERVAGFLDELGRRMFRPTLSRKSLLSTRALQRYTAKVIGDRQLEHLDIPLAAVATDVETREEVVYRRGSTVTAMLASTAVPGVFPAMRIGNRTLVDGGIVNPVPTSVAAELGADVIIGVRLVSGGGGVHDAVVEAGTGSPPSAVAAILGAVELVQARITPRGGTGPTIMVTPQFGELPSTKLRNFSEGRRYIQCGEEAVGAALPRLQAALPWLRG